MRAFAIAAAVAALIVAAVPAHGQGDAADTDTADAVHCAPPATGRRGALDAATLDALLQRLPRCQHRPDWLAAMGHQLNLAQRYVEAADLIERALLLDPDLQGARVDYAVALAGTGDLIAARELLAQVLEATDLPPGLRVTLARQRSLLAQEPAEGWLWTGSVDLRMGYDTNLLGAPNLDSLTLTLGGQLVEVPLDESYRAIGGTYGQADAVLSALRSDADGYWQVGLSLRARGSPATPDADSRQAEVVLEHGRTLPGSTGWRLHGLLAAAGLESGLSDYATRTVVFGVDPRWAPGCDSRVSVEAQWRRYADDPVLSGRYTGMAVSSICLTTLDYRAPAGQDLWSVRAGVDVPDSPDRPGGRQFQAQVRWATNQPLARWQPGWPGYLWFDLDLSLQHDAKGYSPIIESGRSRIIRRAGLRTEVRVPWRDWGGIVLEPAIGVDAVRQWSNIPLFGLDSVGPYAALRGRW
jgi:hypothetical protein